MAGTQSLRTLAKSSSEARRLGKEQRTAPRTLRARRGKYCRLPERPRMTAAHRQRRRVDPKLPLESDLALSVFGDRLSR